MPVNRAKFDASNQDATDHAFVHTTIETTSGIRPTNFLGPMLLFAICCSSALDVLNTSDVLGKEVGVLGLARLESTREGELGVDAINTVNSVEVLDAGDLEASGRTLAGCDRGVGKEVLPDAEPAGTVLSVDLILVAQPVAVPPPEGSRVVDTNGV